MLLKAFKYRIYPTPEQVRMIEQSIGVCRLVYNLALEVKIAAYKNAGINLSAYDIQKQLVDLKAAYPFIGEVDSQAVKESVKSVDVAFKNFYEGAGYPKFKSKKSKQSFKSPNNDRRVFWEKSMISVPKIRFIKAALSRKFEGEIRSITISRTATGKYFASVLVKTADIEIVPKTKNNAIGVDLGITTFATLSTGVKINNPKHLKGSLKRLKVLQCRASKKKRGSSNQKKAFKRVAVLHEKIANRRNDFLHKVSTGLIRDNQTDTICLETLAVKNMVKNHRLAQAISDVSWSEFVRHLEYKGKWYGKNIVRVPTFYPSSKTCSNCNYKKDEMNLSIREWVCDNCGSSHDRDINAAINIKNSGMGSPVEPLELPAIVGAKKKERTFAKARKLVN